VEVLISTKTAAFINDFTEALTSTGAGTEGWQSKVILDLGQSQAQSVAYVDNTSARLNESRVSVSNIGNSVRLLGSLLNVYNTLTQSMTNVNQCNARLAAIADSLFLRNDETNARETLAQCEQLMSTDIVTAVNQANQDYCPAGTLNTGGRMLLHADNSNTYEVTTSGGWNTSLWWPRSHHERFTYQYLNCTTAEECYWTDGLPFIDSSSLPRQVALEIEAMMTYQNAIVTYGRLAQIAANQQLMETQLSTIASNSALLSSATTACATEINVVFGLYQTNAESLAQVAKCAQLIAQESAPHASRCGSSRSSLIAP
jgi:hypothetical protein